MMRLQVDFKDKSTSDGWYDLRSDWVLIEASIAKQYGIRLRKELDMPWGEFCTLVSGLMSDTPLGQMVSIRSETDKNIIKNFTPEQRKIRNDWILRKVNNKLNDKNQLDKDMENLANVFKKMFSKKD